MIKSGDADGKLADLYLDEARLSYQRERYVKALEQFRALYGEKEVAVFSAPGRSEVMGNHTDHQWGEVLAASVNLDAIAVVHPLKEAVVKVTSEGYEEIDISLEKLELREEEKESTKALIKGVLHGFVRRGYKIGGFEAYVTSDVLIGAGLSSSAAFETLMGTILSVFYNGGEISATEIAVIGQYAENVYFGKPCGLMDQMACSVGNLVHVDFADPGKPKAEKIEFDLTGYGYSLCICDTRGSHADLTAEYAAVPAEMKKVASFLGREVLLGITKEELLENIEPLREACGDRAVLRAIHFLEENERVREGVAALKEGDIQKFLQLVNASGRSSFMYLQNVYSSADTRHQNVSLALAVSDMALDPQTEAWRVHGGGFAGTIQAFVRDEHVESYCETMEKVFGDAACHVLKVRKYGGVKVF